MARGVLSQWIAACEGARLRQRAPDLYRGQRHILSLADARHLPQVGERGAARLRVRAQRPALCRQQARAQGGRRLDPAFSRLRHNRAWRPSRPAAVAIRIRPKSSTLPISAAFWNCCPRTSTNARCAMSSRCVTTVSARVSSFHCCASSRCRLSSPTTPNIRTWPILPETLSTSRLQRGKDTVKTAYEPKDIAAWADRLRSWASGSTPDDLPLVEAVRKAKAAPRDVFAYVIHEGKVRAPAGAMALIKRLKA